MSKKWRAKKKRIERFQKVIGGLSLVPICLFPAFMWCILQWRDHDYGFLMPFMGIAIGFLLNEGLKELIKLKVPDAFEFSRKEAGHNLEDYTAGVMCVLSVVFFTVLNASFAPEVKSVRYEIYDLGVIELDDKPDIHYIEVVNERGRLYEVECSKNYLVLHQHADSVSFIKYKSIFGFVYYEEHPKEGL